MPGKLAEKGYYIDSHYYTGAAGPAKVEELSQRIATNTPKNTCPLFPMATYVRLAYGTPASPEIDPMSPVKRIEKSYELMHVDRPTQFPPQESVYILRRDVSKRGNVDYDSTFESATEVPMTPALRRLFHELAPKYSQEIDAWNPRYSALYDEALAATGKDIAERIKIRDVPTKTSTQLYEVNRRLREWDEDLFQKAGIEPLAWPQVKVEGLDDLLNKVPLTKRKSRRNK